MRCCGSARWGSLGQHRRLHHSSPRSPTSSHSALQPLTSLSTTATSHARSTAGTPLGSVTTSAASPSTRSTPSIPTRLSLWATPARSTTALTPPEAIRCGSPRPPHHQQSQRRADAHRHNWIVVGDNETVLRTTDAGASWNGSRAPTNLLAVTIAAPGAGLRIGSTTINIVGHRLRQESVWSVCRSRSREGLASSGMVRTGLALRPGTMRRLPDGWETWSATHPDRHHAWRPRRWARSRDGMGQYSTSRSVASGGYTKAATTVALDKTPISGLAMGRRRLSGAP